MRAFLILAAASAAVMAGCLQSSPVPDPVVVDASGGATTIRDASSFAFSTPAPNLAGADFDLHMQGDAAFEAAFVTAPSKVNPGLGPVFNNTSCVSCHARDGRGNDMTMTDARFAFFQHKHAHRSTGHWARLHLNRARPESGNQSTQQSKHRYPDDDAPDQAGFGATVLWGGGRGGVVIHGGKINRAP